MLLDEHGESRNQHRVELTSHALSEASVVRGYHAQFLIFHPLLEGYHIACHVPHLLYGATTLYLEGIEDILSLSLDSSLICDVICNGPHLLPVELLGIDIHAVIEVGLIDVEVHHAWIRTTYLSDVGITESTTHLSCTAPVFYLGLHARVTTLYHARDHC